MPSTGTSKEKKEVKIATGAIIVVVVVALVAVHLMFFFWPFRFRQVHPLLEHTFQSKVTVQRYHRTYFPHPGFVAENVTFYRHGDTSIPPLATIQRMTVVGTWTTLIFHPHRLYEIRLDGLHVQIPPPGTKARGMDFNNGVVSGSGKMQIQTIVADHTTLDFLRQGHAPLRFEFAALQIHDVQQDKPLSFALRTSLPATHGIVEANGSLGPFRTNAYGSTPMAGTFSRTQADLKGIDGIAGHPSASGHFSGTFSSIAIAGNASIPDFQAGQSNAVRLDTAYRLVVSGTTSDIEIQDVQVRTGQSLITASGSIAGSPKKVALTIATQDSRVEDLLTVVEHGVPSVIGKVSFHAAVDFSEGPGKFLQRLGLKGQASVNQVRFVKDDTQQSMDAFSAREQADPSAKTKPGPQPDPPIVIASASTQTTFAHGVAYFPDIRVEVPGAQAHLQGTFNLLSTQIHLTGKASLERDLSHATTGFKSALLKPLSPFFRHKDAGAIVSVAVTGTAAKPKLAQNVLHDK
jgi:hypothetical protein